MKGDMTDTGAGTPGCDSSLTGATPPANGTDRADAICAARYGMDAGTDDDRARIAGEAETARISLQHKALLATEDDMGGLPESFDIRGKDSLKLQRPDGRTTIANSWSDFFTPDMPARGKVSESGGLLVWTGITENFTLGNHCQNWTSPDDTEYGHYGWTDKTSNDRLGDSTPNRICSTAASSRFICITH